MSELAPPSDHVFHDRRSRDFHALIADRIEKDPSLIEKARSNIRRWRAMVDPGKREPYYLAAWESELDKGLEHTIAFMKDPGEYATQLRQSSPFAGIISQRERLDFLRDWNEKHWPQRARGGSALSS